MLVKGRYVIIDPSLGKNGIREHWAVRIENNMITDSGDTKDLIKKYPEDELIASRTRAYLKCCANSRRISP